MRKIRPIFSPVGPSIAYVPLTREQWSLIEADDICLIDDRNWHAKWDRHTLSYYSASNFRTPHGKRYTVRMQTLLLSPSQGKLSDHKNGNTLDNRRLGNLREATHSQNAANKRVRKDSLSGIKGVRKVGNFWWARVKGNGKYLDYGPFMEKESAKKAYAIAAGLYFNEFSRAA